jgi:hypothetical protein
MLVALTATVTFAAQAHAQDVDCGDFAFQEDAQAVLNADPSDPNRLDADDDGIACEVLLRRGDLVTPTMRPPSPTMTSASPTMTSASPTMTTAAPTTAPPSPTPTPTTSAPRPVAPATMTPSQGVRGGIGGASSAGPSKWDIAIGLVCLTSAGLATGYVIKRRRG